MRQENFHQDHNYTSIMGSESNFINKHSRNLLTAFSLKNMVDDVRCNGSIRRYACVCRYNIRYRPGVLNFFMLNSTVHEICHAHKG